MEKLEIMKYVDHTLLSQSATWDEIKIICDDGIKYGCASVCIPPSFVSKAKEYTGGRIAICTVIGFPNGYSTTSVKAFETEAAVSDGADEIDMVINVGFLKEKKYAELLDEINRVKRACGEKLLKVIVETCLLTEEEKIKACEIINESDAEFIKTSTGFSTGGATLEDIKLFSERMVNGKRIKAAGGIKSFDDAEAFLKLGASRLGTSRLVRLLNNEENVKGY